jgi:cell fate regulator YaaT (PSP1 superfamily)
MRRTVNVNIGDTNPPTKFDTTLDVKFGDRVIVETAYGADWGVVAGPCTTAKGNTSNNLIIRLADEADNKVINKLITSAKYAMKMAGEKIAKYRLDMKLISAAYTFDSAKVVIQFFAENRVDFRELVKDLAYTLRTRIELKQIGNRDEVKIIGSMGPCGMQCCCSRFIENFDNITIKMAKTQNIPLQPTKINGMCGRLLCC